MTVIGRVKSIGTEVTRGIGFPTLREAKEVDDGRRDPPRFPSDDRIVGEREATQRRFRRIFEDRRNGDVGAR